MSANLCSEANFSGHLRTVKATSSPDEARTYYKDGEEQLEIRLSLLHFKSEFLICRYVDVRKRNGYYHDKKSESCKRPRHHHREDLHGSIMESIPLTMVLCFSYRPQLASR